MQQMSRPCCAPSELLPRGGQKLTSMAVCAAEGGVVSGALATAALLRPAPQPSPRHLSSRRVSIFHWSFPDCTALPELRVGVFTVPPPSGCWSSHVCACWWLCLHSLVSFPPETASGPRQAPCRIVWNKQVNPRWKALASLLSQPFYLSSQS